MEIKKNFNVLKNDYIQGIFNNLGTSLEGLEKKEAEDRLEMYGYNEIGQEKNNNIFFKFMANFKNPLVLLLIVVSFVSYITGDILGAVIMFIIICLSVVLGFVQEFKADNSAGKLKAMVNTTATVIRNREKKEIELRKIVPGDIIHLSSGDMIPADVKVIISKDLFVNQSALTGESLPVEKYLSLDKFKNPLENPNLCFMGSNVESGTAVAVVINTSSNTYLGKLSNKLTEERPMTSFDRGINSYTWLMIKIICILAPVVFLINGFTKGNFENAFMYAIAVAVGLTPQMLPMLVTVNLSKGAMEMSKKKVIVKRLNAIQDFGAMDILCTDKTGTLTCGKVVLEKYLNIYGEDSNKVLNYGYLNSFYQTGLKNLMDEAILEHKNQLENLNIEQEYKKIDEIPFDFKRKRMSIVVKNNKIKDILICKGAVEELLELCNKYEDIEEKHPLTDSMKKQVKEITKNLNKDGFRVIAVAYKNIKKCKEQYLIEDENKLTLLGFMAFLDPPKETSKEAIEKLNKYKVDVKILTGDNEIVTKKICKEVNLPIDSIVLGADIDNMTDEELGKIAEKTTVFAKLSPMHKERIINALKMKEHVVGFMGDGINDAPALKTADVGISVNTAVDIAKESSDIILLENSLLVLEEGILEGRKVFGNIVKYIKMAASSNFGNMFSVLGASIMIPFLPMKPLQVLTNNLLYDISQTTIPTDNVDEEWIERPRKWDVKDIKRFIFLIGPISSIFDYITYFIMLYVFKSFNNPALFQTGWFLESLCTQTLIIHVIRTNKIPFVESKGSKPLKITSLFAIITGILIVNSSLAEAFGFVKLPFSYYPILILILISYVFLTQIVKNYYIKKFEVK